MPSDALNGDSPHEPAQSLEMLRKRINSKGKAAGRREVAWVLFFSLIPYLVLLAAALTTPRDTTRSFVDIALANGAPYMSILTIAGLGLAGTTGQSTRSAPVLAALVVGSVLAATMFGIRLTANDIHLSSVDDIIAIIALAGLVLPGVYYSGYLREVGR